MLKIFNTLGKKRKDFKPLKKNHVSFYQCGPTVYWTQHIGNMRAMVLADLIRRSMEYLGYKVRFARNYTDVGHLTSDSDEGEDKLQVRAKREGMSPQKLADKYIKQFEADVRALNCEEPWKKPRATRYIKEMAKMIQVLIDKGYAYATKRAIYFDVAKAKNYTALSGQDLEKNIDLAGKGDVGDGGKKNNHDFALWFFKTGMHQHDLQTWKAQFRGIKQPVAEGSPGWHLECSAMNKSLFGPTIDIHMGGIEHVPVHHTNEIAQSEAANGVKFVNYWLHNEHLTIDGKKMSKSGGTAYSLSNIMSKGFEPLILRYFFLGSHYRSKQNFTWEALEAANSALTGLKEKIAGLSDGKKGKVDENYKQKLIAALEDDFNIPSALSLIFEILKLDLPNADKLATILDFDKVLGLGWEKIKSEKIPTAVIKLAEERQRARAKKNWIESDRLRDELAGMGWQVKDTPGGYELKK